MLNGKMNIIKYTALTVLSLVLITAGLQAKEAVTYIAEDSEVVIGFRLNHILKKAGFGAISQIPHISDFEMQLKKAGISNFIKYPELYGVKIKSTAFITLNTVDSKPAFSSIVIQIKDKEDLAKAFADTRVEITQEGKYSYVESTDSKYIISWADDAVIMLLARDEKYSSSLKKELRKMMYLSPFDALVIKDKDFNLLQKKPWDVSVYTDASEKDEIFETASTNETLNSLAKLFTANYSGGKFTALVHLEYEHITIDFNRISTSSEKTLQSVLRPVSSKALSYIPAENILAAACIGIDMDEYRKGIKSSDSLKRSHEEIKSLFSMMDFDADDVMDVLSGDIVLTLREDASGNEQAFLNAGVSSSSSLDNILNKMADSGKLKEKGSSYLTTKGSVHVWQDDGMLFLSTAALTAAKTFTAQSSETKTSIIKLSKDYPLLTYGDPQQAVSLIRNKGKGSIAFILDGVFNSVHFGSKKDSGKLVLDFKEAKRANILMTASLINYLAVVANSKRNKK